MKPPTRVASRPHLRYQLLLVALAPLLIVYTAWQALRAREPRYLRERLGFYRHRSPIAPIWVHAASVGEVNAALPLIEALRERFPDLPLLLTTTTPTGAALARQRLPAAVRHAYLPIDWRSGVRRFFQRIRPRCGLIVETELWPHLYAMANRRCPLLIVNGRVSPRTLKAPHWLRELYRGCLDRVQAVLARSEKDRAGFLSLGAEPHRVEVIGNIKFSTVSPAGVVEPLELGRPYVLAASTREEEEVKVAKAWEAAGLDRLLVIAPRHPRRLAEILAKLSGYRVAVRSRNEPIQPDTQVYLADTLGELDRLMAGAEWVFMGGSLVPKGGHNLLEPARLGKAVVFGPSMDNFADEARLLLDEQAALQAQTVDELAVVFHALAHDPEQRDKLGRRAQALVEARRDMASRYVEKIGNLCGL